MVVAMLKYSQLRISILSVRVDCDGKSVSVFHIHQYLCERVKAGIAGSVSRLVENARKGFAAWGRPRGDVDRHIGSRFSEASKESMIISKVDD